MSWLFSRWRRRRRELDKRVSAARAGAEAARAEVARSRERQKLIRENVVKPRQAVAAHNQFADMIRATLTDGQRRRNA